jgi:hypothetical protein
MDPFGRKGGYKVAIWSLYGQPGSADDTFGINWAPRYLTPAMAEKGVLERSKRKIDGSGLYGKVWISN